MSTVLASPSCVQKQKGAKNFKNISNLQNVQLPNFNGFIRDIAWVWLEKKILGEHRKKRKGETYKMGKEGTEFWGEEQSKVLRDGRKEKGRKRMACLSSHREGQDQTCWVGTTLEQAVGHNL